MTILNRMENSTEYVGLADNLGVGRVNSFLFWKNIILVSVFLVATPLTIFTSIFSLSLLNEPSKPKNEIAVVSNYSNVQGVQVFASLPTKTPQINLEPEVADARVEIVRQYLKNYNSVLEPYAPVLVEAADKNSIDWKLLPAIAQQESNLCKWIPPGGHNCWGWGIHSQGTLGFDSFETAIHTVAAGLKKEYIDKGYVTPTEIMSKYTPLSNGSWARGVTEFMSDLEQVTF